MGTRPTKPDVGEEPDTGEGVRDPVELHEAMKAGLRRLVTRYRGQLQAQASCEQSKEPGKAPLAQVELDGFTYVITRFESPSKKLSPREREVAILVAEGLPNKVIARRLGIRPSSVATHLRRAYRKLNVDSRAALALQSLLS